MSPLLGDEIYNVIEHHTEKDVMTISDLCDNKTAIRRIEV